MGSIAPSRDRNDWYYPAVRPMEDEETELPMTYGKRHRGNWGNKMQPGARWMKLGKCSSWGPSHAEWEVRTVVWFVGLNFVDGFLDGGART